jgi:hypothetical protein
MAHNLDYKKSPTYKSYQDRAIKKFPGQAVLSKKDFSDLTQKECHYCGKEGPNGIDRIDNTTGYVLSNCVPCCKHCNYVKGDLSKEDFETWKKRFISKNNPME